MTTLLAIHTAAGATRCDARCYNAKGADCDCVCGGANHGKGFGVALANTKSHATQMITAYAALNGLDEYEVEQPEAIQLPLFSLEGM